MPQPKLFLMQSMHPAESATPYVASWRSHLGTSIYLSPGGRWYDSLLLRVAAPKQRNTEPENAAIKEGRTAAEIWPDAPARAAQKDTDARWTLKFAKGRPAANGKPQIDTAIPSFGYKSSIAICRAFGFIRKGKVTDGAKFDGRMLRDVGTNDNTASDVWADTAYRSQSNEKWLKAQVRVSRVHRRKPRGKPMPEHIRRGNATKSKVRGAPGSQETAGRRGEMLQKRPNLPKIPRQPSISDQIAR